MTHPFHMRATTPTPDPTGFMLIAILAVGIAAILLTTPTPRTENPLPHWALNIELRR